MKKVLVAYFSVSGKTEIMAQFIAEGIRFSGLQAEVKKLIEIRSGGLTGYDGYILGSPTFSLDLPKPVQTFLTEADKTKLEGKPGGAFGSYKHDASYKHDSFAPALIMGILEKQCKMKPFELGPLTLQEESVETKEGLKACQDYGRVFGEKLG